MREAVRSPSEYYIRFLISQNFGRIDPSSITDQLDGLGLDSLNNNYIRSLAEAMEPLPDPYVPENPRHTETRAWLRAHKIYDMWNPTKAVREAQHILMDVFLREKLEPLLLSSMNRREIARKLRKFTAIALTEEGVNAFGHYYWNRSLLTQQQWMAYLESQSHVNVYRQALLIPPDQANRHMPWVAGMSGPPSDFNTADASARICQIAYKHALELEHTPATLDTTMALKNCMITIAKGDDIMRRSDVALRDVLKQFHKFRMKLDKAEIVPVQQLTDGNYSKSGEGTDLDDDDDF
jgi:hypothetical protein